MKLKYIILVLAALTLGVGLFLTENLFTVWEQASFAKFRPVTIKTAASQIHRDVPLAGMDVDIFTGPTGEKIKRPLLIFVHGGFFQGGNKKNYAYIGNQFVRRGYAVILVGVPQYPGLVFRNFRKGASKKKSSLVGQLESFSAFTKQLAGIADQYGFDKNQMHFFSHGSGAVFALAVEPQAWKSIILISPLLSLAEIPQSMPLSYQSAFRGWISDEFAKAHSWQYRFDKMKNPTLLICSANDLPALREQCEHFKEKFSERINLQIHETQASHFALLFHVGSKIEPMSVVINNFLQAK